MWLDGADELAAAERAEAMRSDGPKALAHLVRDPEAPAESSEDVGMSIGIATRWPLRAESVDELIQRADHVMYEVKRSGRGQWRVAQAADT